MEKLVTEDGVGRQVGMEFTEENVVSLAAKLDGLELSDGERAAFAAALEPVAGSSGDRDEEVSGFAMLRLSMGEVVSQRALLSFPPSAPGGAAPDAIFMDAGECR